MKDHLILLFDKLHRNITIRYLSASITLIVASQVAGIKDNLIGMSALVTGLCFLYIAFVYPWEESRKYARMAWIGAAILAFAFTAVCLLSWLGIDRSAGETIVMFVIFLICLPGIIVGILGAVFYD